MEYPNNGLPLTISIFLSGNPFDPPRAVIIASLLTKYNFIDAKLQLNFV